MSFFQVGCVRGSKVALNHSVVIFSTYIYIYVVCMHDTHYNDTYSCCFSTVNRRRVIQKHIPASPLCPRVVQFEVEDARLRMTLTRRVNLFDEGGRRNPQFTEVDSTGSKQASCVSH